MKLLEIENLQAGYGPITALFGVSLSLQEGQTLALIGANGAGKTTLLRSIVGLIRPGAGHIRFEGRDIGGCAAHQVAAQGIAMVPEGRRLFASLTVEENLRMGACAGRAGPWTLQSVYELFPVLQERSVSLSTKLSGGQQQMVAVGRALMSNPRLLLCDELSLGLAPIVVQDIYRTLRTVTDSGVSLVVVEQDIRQAIAASDHFICLREGRVALAGTQDTAGREDLAQAYFGN